MNTIQLILFAKMYFLILYFIIIIKNRFLLLAKGVWHKERKKLNIHSKRDSIKGDFI